MSYLNSRRVMSFEEGYKPYDTASKRPAEKTFAQELKKQFEGMVPAAPPAPASHASSEAPTHSGEFALASPADVPDESGVDVIARFESEAIAALRADDKLMTKLQGERGAAWVEIKAF